jgi:hypothetical protein
VPLLADGNLVDVVWGAAQPPLPLAPMRVHPLEWAGESVADKLAAMRQKMKGEARAQTGGQQARARPRLLLVPAAAAAVKPVRRAGGRAHPRERFALSRRAAAAAQSAPCRTARLRPRPPPPAAEAGALLATGLDEVAWLLNLRGSDVDYNPGGRGAAVPRRPLEARPPPPAPLVRRRRPIPAASGVPGAFPAGGSAHP